MTDKSMSALESQRRGQVLMKREIRLRFTSVSNRCYSIVYVMPLVN